ncbi:Alpha-D-glucose 1-phosphate phosphatase YihX [Acaryochloris thomasi RCC1774]|uniref:Alpha-D-glucose 1-phosphate phosphatase YihX n=1 Tax=Acaryochloris thomasi RCC1774 TaxID=1764569 RepID=A0A2W1JPP6_9CYAN|nr:HAD family phosphatase [Acaryochloris thomasi]PZD75310.1 Alpha-D-glucose 1-phosphate phosphatase YihX [Acaryochloris thomasi RCC1774]
MESEVRTLLFDLGGVIVELEGQPIKNNWIGSNDSPKASWEKWLTSDAPRAFETGKISADEFANRMISDLKMSISAADFKEYFTNWPIGPYPGAIEFLKSLKSRFTVALFSNSNELHWERKMNEMALDGVFHQSFASHLMGLAKPDPEAFRYVIEALESEPAEILFLDDNRLNVEAARIQGLQAEEVHGLSEAKRCLYRRRLYLNP